MADDAETEFSGARYLYFTNSPEVKTFQYDEDLPSLPVPALNLTLQKYLESVRPFVNEEEFITTRQTVTEFENGIGKELQKLLQQRASSRKNWMEDWWLDYAYLMERTPLLPSHNMAGAHPLNITDWSQSESKAMEYISTSVWLLLEFFIMVRKERLRPQFSANGDSLCMHQFKNFFNLSRIPKENKDELVSWFKTENEGDCPMHMIVLCKGHVWLLDPWDSEGERLDIFELEQQFSYVQKQSILCDAGPGIAALTLDDRDNWAKHREWLQSLSVRNAENLELVESAIGHFSIEDGCPANFDELYWESLCGFSDNRWADKSYTGTVFKNGMLGSNCEHTPCDAMVSVLIGHFTHEVVSKEMLGKKIETIRRKRYIKMPHRLHFDLDSLLYKGIAAAKEYSFNLQSNIDARYFFFTHFGRTWIKANKFHCDTFVQCALQLAYYKMYKRIAPTYETATTRQFYHGRTETVRSCTSEMVDWVECMHSNGSSNAEKKRKLNVAMTTHFELMKECQSGQGIDRHLMGLYLIAIENDFSIPDIFTQPAFSKSGGGGNFVLSTSTVGPSTTLGGLPPMVENGYAVIYSFCPNRIQFTLTSFKGGETCLDRFIASLTDSLVEMQELKETPTSNI